MLFRKSIPKQLNLYYNIKNDNLEKQEAVQITNGRVLSVTKKTNVWFWMRIADSILSTNHKSFKMGKLLIPHQKSWGWKTRGLLLFRPAIICCGLHYTVLLLLFEFLSYRWIHMNRFRWYRPSKLKSVGFNSR